ncbi:hypothetical protein ACS0TY_035152 [Phlomoides rotata]
MADNLPLLMTRFKLSDPDIKNSAPATKLINNVCVSTSDVQIDSSRSLWFRLFTPSITDTNSDTLLLPLIVYFHGGGFRRFGPDNKIYDDLCSHLAAKVPAVIASVNFRSTPEHKYPSQYEDGYDALKFIDAHNTAVLPAYTDLGSCFIGGDSSGANIAHHVTVRLVKNGEQLNKVRIAGLVSVQPFFGGEERTESELRLAQTPMFDLDKADNSWRELLPEGADRDHPAVNVSGGGPNSEVKNLEFPPTLVIVGGIDPLQDRGKRYAEWLKNCGKEVELSMYPDAFHAFYFFPQVPEFDMLFQTLNFFIHKHVHPN